MTDDLPKILLVAFLFAVVAARVWIVVDRSSPAGRRLRRWWAPRARPVVFAIVALLSFLAIAEDVAFDERDEIVFVVDRIVEASVVGVPVQVRATADAASHLTAVGLAVLLGAGVLVLLVVGRPGDAATVLVGTLTAVGSAEVLKAAYSLSRSGFPSASAVFVVVGGGTMAWVLSRNRARLTRFGLIAIAAAVALAAETLRIITGAHGASDVLGGLAFGGAWLAMVIGAAESGMRLRRRTRVRLTQAARRSNRRPATVRYQATGVAEGYDRRFEGIRGRYNNWRLRRLLRDVTKRLPPHAVVLDMPCGTGRIDRWLLEESFHVVAADVSGAMLEVARRKMGPVPAGSELLAADAHCLPFRSKSVDAVFSIRFVHLLDRAARLAALTELARVSRDWVLVEYRGIEKPGRAAKRAIAAALTGQPACPRKMRVTEIATELDACGLAPERYYFPSRLFSGSVLVLARRT